MGRSIRFYFDFISPYSFLAIELIHRTPEFATWLEHPTMPFVFCPISFGTILAKRGVKGPGEIPERRKRGLEDVLCLANLYGIELEGPPAHPFNSIYAARSVLDVSEPLRGKLTLEYFRAAWARGENLEDITVLNACLRRLGIAQDPEEAASKRENRQMLKALTQEALHQGAWGVPTFVVDDLLFFGHDRLMLLDAYVRGRVRLDHQKLQRLLARPQPGRLE